MLRLVISTGKTSSKFPEWQGGSENRFHTELKVTGKNSFHLRVCSQIRGDGMLVLLHPFIRENGTKPGAPLQLPWLPLWKDT